MATPYFTKPARKLQGEIRVASDKSISHRSIIFSSLAEGTSHVRNILTGEDVKCTLNLFRQMGVKTSQDAETLNAAQTLEIEGVGLDGLRASATDMYCGNSGTTMRLMLGVLAAQNFDSRLTGDASLDKRPMERVTKPLGLMGAHFQVLHENDRRVLKVYGTRGLKGIQYDSPVASAQIKSSLLLAGLFAEGVTTITEPSASRDHSEIMLKSMGARLEQKNLSVSIQRGPLKPIDIEIPGDISSAAFFMVAALITPGSDIMIRHVGLNPTRTGIMDVLIAMGGDITIESQYQVGGEVVGDLRFRSSHLRNLEVSGDMIPRLIDEIPILALAATQAEGQMVIRDARELRVKESDRLKTVYTELTRLGASIQETEDGLVIEGSQKLKGTLEESKSYGDHRLAMMIAIAGLILDEPVKIDDVECVSTSFPQFFELLENLK